MNEENPKVPYAQATVGEAERDAVASFLDNPEELVGGTWTSEFEDRVSSLFGKEFGVMVNSGSSANLLAVELADFDHGTEVVTPIVTSSTTVAPLVQQGLIPVFTDVGLGDYQVDVDQVEEAITPETGGLMIPNLLGNLPEMDRLRELTDEHDLVYIEDSADTLGATFDGDPTGTYSDISTTSFYGSHVITALGGGGGGMISVDDRQYRDRLRVLRGWGRSSAVTETETIEQRYENSIGDLEYDAKFLFEEIGYNFHPLEASAAFGMAQVEKLSKFANRRRDNVRRLNEFFCQYEKQFIVPKELEGVKSSWLGYPLVVAEEASFSRAELAKYLERRNIQTRPLFSGNILRHPAFEAISRREVADSYPNADRIMRGSLVVGCHQSLTDEQLGHVERTIRNFLSNH